MILLLGATGYTGRRILRSLLRAGETVRCLVRRDAELARVEDAGAEVVKGDLDCSSSNAAFDGVTAVVNAAHIRYASAVIEGCERYGVRRVVAYSSTWRFSSVITPDVDAVVQGERRHEDSGLDTTILRPTMIYGPGNDRNVSRLRAHIRKRAALPVFGSGESLVQPVHVDDAAEAASAVLRRTGTHGKSYQLAGGSAISYGHMLDTIAEAEGRTLAKVYVPVALGVLLAKVYAMISARPAFTEDQVKRMREDRSFDISEAVRDFGYAPRSFEVGMREVIAAELEDGRGR